MRKKKSSRAEKKKFFVEMEQAKQRGNEEELEAKHILAWEEDLQVHLLWFPCLFPFIALFFIHSSGSWTLLDCLVVKLCYYYDFLPIFFWFSSDDKFGCGFSCATDHRSHWFLHEMGFHLMGLLFVLLTVLCLRTFCSFVLGSLYPLSVPPLLRMVLDCVCYNFGWCRSISCHACNYAHVFIFWTLWVYPIILHIILFDELPTGGHTPT